MKTIDHVVGTFYPQRRAVSSQYKSTALWLGTSATIVALGYGSDVGEMNILSDAFKALGGLSSALAVFNLMRINTSSKYATIIDTENKTIGVCNHITFEIDGVLDGGIVKHNYAKITNVTSSPSRVNRNFGNVYLDVLFSPETESIIKPAHTIFPSQNTDGTRSFKILGQPDYQQLCDKLKMHE